MMYMDEIHANTIKLNHFYRLSSVHFEDFSKNIIPAYITDYVRPLLEYASCSWSPCNVSSMKMVEAVQRKFTKMLRGMSNLDYKERLAFLDAETLELRRLKIDLVTVYEILFGLIDIDFNGIRTL